MPDLYNHERHEPPEDNDGIFKHDPHRAGNSGDTCNRFPGPSYPDCMEEEVFCGVDYCEINLQFGFTHVRCPLASTSPCLYGRHSLHLDSLVVAVAGACPGNGSYLATKSTCGVCFSPGALENLVFRVPDTPEYSHTSQRAELNAAIAAIEASKTYIFNGGQWRCGDACPTPCALTHLVIKSDSAYFVDGMTVHIEQWRKKGWRTARRTEVKNRDLWTKLYDMVYLLYVETGVAIDFWHVPRDQNEDAHVLANLGLHITS
ncbi:ribonuclease H-like protein [Xylaria longipes]|nr:ribonuclease H-like protein [Xylaria longipes]